MNINISENILITTAISYTNGSPHIGHLYESILADFIKKVYQINSPINSNIKLLTGTDEHGKKIQSNAQELGIEPIELCDKYSNEFKQMNLKIGTTFDYFIRTTQPIHKNLVSNTIEKILNSNPNPIYSHTYKGYYSIREESFISEIQAALTNYQDPITLKPYEIINEPTYYFKQSKYMKNIYTCVQTINPPEFKKDIIYRLEKGLDDLSISRTSFTWVIPFPNDSTHIVYVWFDALLNYITGANILFENSNNIKMIHIIGKDILWFHSVIYPAILAASDLNNLSPYKILTHGFVLDKDGNKMSKSLGNVINIQKLFNLYPNEAIRYYFITNTILGKDFKFDSEILSSNYNNILVKDFGNLFQRLFKIIKPIYLLLNDYFNNNNDKIISVKLFYIQQINMFLESFDFSFYNNLLMSIINNLNKTLSDKKPWAINKQDEQIEIMGDIIINFNIGMCLMYPIIPDKILKLANYLGWTNKLNLHNYRIELNIGLVYDKIKAFELIKK